MRKVEYNMRKGGGLQKLRKWECWVGWYRPYMTTSRGPSHREQSLEEHHEKKCAQKRGLYHKLRGSATPVLTATHHSYGSPRLSDFYSLSALGVWPPPTNFDAKWLKRRGFAQGCAFCNKNRNFSYPLISRDPKRSRFHKFLDLENFSLDLAFNIRGPESKHPFFFIRAQ